MEDRSKALKGILFLAFVFFVILLIFAFFTMKAIKTTGDLPSFGEVEGSQIAVVEVEGAILESKKIIENLFEAEKNKKIKAIIVRIDSPGGAVGPTQEIYEEMIRIDQKIPVYASFGSLAASGGYYLGAAARKIFASKGTLTGSIGVIMQFVDASKLVDLVKVRPNVIKAGKYKDIGNMTREMTLEEKEILETTISKVHEQFRSDILNRRKDKIKGDFNALTQGQIFSGEEALEFGLVDEIGGLYAAGRKIHEELKLKGEFKEFKFIKKKKKMSILEIAENLEESASRVGKILSNLESPVQLLFR